MNIAFENKNETMRMKIRLRPIIANDFALNYLTTTLFYGTQEKSWNIQKSGENNGPV